jgi:hypothetical protein
MFVPLSSMNTGERASSDWATITFQAALGHSSRSIAPTVFFSREALLLRSLLKVGSLRLLPAKLSRK